MSAPPLDLRALCTAALEQCPAGATLRVAFSGGLDSTVLLHALAHAGVAPLAAVHVHHGLQPAADAWVRHCARQCQTLGVPLAVRRVEVQPHAAAGPEAAARQARYAALRALMAPGDCLAVAHQREDQAETVLLRLLRGTGIDGLAAMRESMDFPPGRLWRPFLNVPRAVLRAWAQAWSLSWVEDPHNRELRYRRVWVRRQLLPRLESATPAIGERLARLAAGAARAADCMREQAELDLARLAGGSGRLWLGVAALQALPVARRHNAVRAWLRGRGFALPSSAALDRLEQEVLAARGDAMPVLRVGDCELRRYRGRLYALQPLPAPPAGAQPWVAGTVLVLAPGCGQLVAQHPPPQPLTVSFPRGGERLRPAGRRHEHTLKNLFQEGGVAPWWRARTPLIHLHGRLAWVGGVACSQSWQDWCKARDWALYWAFDGAADRLGPEG